MVEEDLQHLRSDREIQVVLTDQSRAAEDAGR
jgi:hypothetical protein